MGFSQKASDRLLHRLNGPVRVGTVIHGNRFPL